MKETWKYAYVVVIIERSFKDIFIFYIKKEIQGDNRYILLRILK